jgi:hypothetical protein
MVQLSSFLTNWLNISHDLELDQLAELGHFFKPFNFIGSTVLEYLTDYPEAISDVKELIPQGVSKGWGRTTWA